MATYGKPEASVQRCSAEIARLRTKRNWSRAKLVARLYDELELGDPNFDSISESWLKRLESGQMVKLSRQTLEAICKALNCTPQERVSVLILADRNVFAEADGTTERVAVALTRALIHLKANPMVHEILGNIIGQRRAEDLDENELLELIVTAERLVRKQNRK
jgi:transcriptional regulator with XRE-family HTH domain